LPENLLWKRANQGKVCYEWEDLVKMKTRIQPINVAGKNFARFDSRCIERVPRFNDIIAFSGRVLDPAMLYWNPISDKRLPSLEECCKRAQINSTIEHTSVSDALKVIELIRVKTENYTKV
jgi:hypothetical protein